MRKSLSLNCWPAKSPLVGVPAFLPELGQRDFESEEVGTMRAEDSFPCRGQSPLQRAVSLCGGHPCLCGGQFPLRRRSLLEVTFLCGGHFPCAEAEVTSLCWPAPGPSGSTW